MKRFRNRAALNDLLRGVILGGAMSVPGVSGGTTAIAAGCYERILNAAADPFRKEHLRFLALLSVGGAIGFFTAARVVSVCFRILPLTMTMLFAGAAAGGLYPDAQQLLRRKLHVNDLLFFLLGVCCVLAVRRIPAGNGIPPLLYFPLGLILAAGVILPGISTSHLLVVFGLYGSVTGIKNGADLLRLLPLFCGILVGIAVESRPLAAAMRRYPSAASCALLGFACGSFAPLIELCIGNPGLAHRTVFQAVNGVILCAGAFAVTVGFRRKKENPKEM